MIKGLTGFKEQEKEPTLTYFLKTLFHCSVALIDRKTTHKIQKYNRKQKMRYKTNLQNFTLGYIFEVR